MSGTHIRSIWLPCDVSPILYYSAFRQSRPASNFSIDNLRSICLRLPFRTNIVGAAIESPSLSMKFMELSNPLGTESRTMNLTRTLLIQGQSIAWRGRICWLILDFYWSQKTGPFSAYSGVYREVKTGISLYYSVISFDPSPILVRGRDR